MPERDVYLLSPRALSPETIAVAFAKTSRSPESFRDIAAELSDESSAKFHEKWVVGYGHASVAEHAVLHLAFENVSRIAIESIESNRLASYTEKSTRYQRWGLDDFTTPPELDGHPLHAEYVDTIRLLFRTYADSLTPVQTLIFERFPRREKESDEAWDRRIRSKYVDVCRFLLPAAALAVAGRDLAEPADSVSPIAAIPDAQVGSLFPLLKATAGRSTLSLSTATATPGPAMNPARTATRTSSPAASRSTSPSRPRTPWTPCGNGE